MFTRTIPDYLSGYPASLVEQVHLLIGQGQFGDLLRRKYPGMHSVRTDKALYDYVQELKGEYLRNAPQPDKVAFDSKLHVIHQALGTHTRISRVQGAKLKSKHEIRIASVFKTLPSEFLRMIVVHEVAHLKVREHDKDFYQLCRYMEPDYHQLEFDLRACLLCLDTTEKHIWPAGCR
ncbi:YgjP-like metallopeptidase domain-containing protein [Propionivibrio limicola]|uniref:YgjP-like metallopeptidase domain-containing protein n=1 Tax=Propionivibrio limicola TaxID=167645 RepID=UPI001292B867|nr:YgjP-like metallopeptidase domain-containing protein [Propionivibrio limicola]